MAKIFYDNEADLSLIQDRKKVALIGYGCQGHAHALNLTDSGVTVRVGLPRGQQEPAPRREAAGLQVAVGRRGLGRRAPTSS